MRILSKKDLFLLAGVFLAGLLILAFCFSTVSDGQTVNICVDGKTVAKLPLAVDCEYLVNGYRGGHNLIQIKDDGQIYSVICTFTENENTSASWYGAMWDDTVRIFYTPGDGNELGSGPHGGISAGATIEFYKLN